MSKPSGRNTNWPVPSAVSTPPPNCAIWSAHILGQRYFSEHLRSHLWMLAWAWRQRDWAEGLAQLLRIPGSLGSLLGLFPLGNPGTRRVGPLTPQAVPEDLQVLLK